jgi:intraflagellar transport protein 56
LRREFQDANVYLNSIATYLISSDAFNWNYGLSLAACERFNEAEEVLLRVQSVALRTELEYCSWLARVYIQNRRHAGLAWELYLGMENTADAFRLLKLVANDYYKVSPAPCLLYGSARGL